MNIFDMDGLYCGPEHHEEFGPSCPACDADLEWEDCEACGGDGGQDTEPWELYMGSGRDWDECQQCEGHGGWYMCYEKHTEEQGRRHCWLPNELPKEGA